MYTVLQKITILHPPPVDFLHDAVLESHGDDGGDDTDRTDEVRPVSGDVEHRHLQDVGRHHLEAPDHHHLAWRDPADGQVHHDAAHNADQRHHDAEDAHSVVPLPEYRLVVNPKHPNETDHEAAHAEPEDEDGVVDVSQLPV